MLTLKAAIVAGRGRLWRGEPMHTAYRD